MMMPEAAYLPAIPLFPCLTVPGAGLLLDVDAGAFGSHQEEKMGEREKYIYRERCTDRGTNDVQEKEQPETRDTKQSTGHGDVCVCVGRYST